MCVCARACVCACVCVCACLHVYVCDWGGGGGGVEGGIMEERLPVSCAKVILSFVDRPLLHKPDH